MENRNDFQMFKNSGYTNQRNRNQTLILDIDDTGSGDTHLGAGGDFNIELFEPLIIDKHSEVYLDNCLTFNSNISQTPSSSAFVLKINEFNINSNVASSSHNNNIYNSLVIPNEHENAVNNHGAILHKSKKMNYVCDINPQTIYSLSGKITDLSGSSIFHGTDSSHQFTYALTGIDADNLNKAIDISTDASKKFTTIQSNSGIQNVSGEFLVSHTRATTTLHFSTETEITNSADFTTATGDITFNPTSGNVIVSNTAGENPSLMLIQNAGRFIAEFTIISRE